MENNYIKVMQGLYGSGKSLYIKDQISAGNWPSYATIISGTQYNQKVLAVTAPHLARLSVAAFIFRKVIQAVTSKAAFIVVNDPHLTIESVAPYQLLAESYDYSFELVTIETKQENYCKADKDLLDLFSCPKDWARKVV
jgi:predicted kinase